MQRLYQFYFLFKEYIVFSLLVLVSIVLLTQNDNEQVRRIRSLAVGMIGALQNAVSIFPNVFVLQHENELLRRMNVNLVNVVWLNDKLTCRGSVRELTPEGPRQRAHLQIWCEKADGTKAVIGSASALVA